MVVFSDCFFDSIPKPNLFCKAKTQGVIGKGKRNPTASDLIRGMQRTVHVIVCSDDYWHIHIVTSIDLGWLIDEAMAEVQICIHVVLNLVEIAIWCPTVSVDYSDKHVIRVDHQLCEFVFHMLNTPRDI